MVSLTIIFYNNLTDFFEKLTTLTFLTIFTIFLLNSEFRQFQFHDLLTIFNYILNDFSKIFNIFVQHFHIFRAFLSYSVFLITYFL